MARQSFAHGKSGLAFADSKRQFPRLRASSHSAATQHWLRGV
jgi:hypothetical protein